MKIIISHDVDHIGSLCHWYKDLFWEKWIIKAFLFLLRGQIGWDLFVKRLRFVFSLKIENMDRMMELDREYNVPSTFFVGVNNALGMSYSIKAAKEMVHRLRRNGFDVGVHGVAYDDKLKIDSEHRKFADCLLGSDGLSIESDSFGIRNHYLRGREDRQMHGWQSDAGYIFDSTDYGLVKPYKVGGMWEFPLSLMEGYLMTEKTNDMDEIKRITIEQLQEAETKGLPYFTILMHNLSDVFPDYDEWYKWFLDYTHSRYEYISFRDAIKELEATNK